MIKGSKKRKSDHERKSYQGGSAQDIRDGKGENRRKKTKIDHERVEDTRGVCERLKYVPEKRRKKLEKLMKQKMGQVEEVTEKKNETSNAEEESKTGNDRQGNNETPENVEPELEKDNDTKGNETPEKQTVIENNYLGVHQLSRCSNYDHLPNLQPYVLLQRLEDMVVDDQSDTSEKSVDIKNDFFPSEDNEDDEDYIPIDVPSESTSSEESSGDGEVSDVEVEIPEAEVKVITKVTKIVDDLDVVNQEIQKKKMQLEYLEETKKRIQSKLLNYEPTSEPGNICFICNKIHERTRRHLPQDHKEHPRVKQWLEEKDSVLKEAYMKLMIYEGKEHLLIDFI